MMITTKTDVLLVTTTRPMVTSDSRLVIPRGKFGRVLEVKRGTMLIDFGLQTVQRLPVGSDAIRIVRA